ncbi:unnamed protein product [Caenorhabditis sp. 36 PRJEB53466]|nr:unnamed protein product [Caenorhabditis sp. 36 PRJEB53466]
MSFAILKDDWSKATPEQRAAYLEGLNDDRIRDAAIDLYSTCSNGLLWAQNSPSTFCEHQLENASKSAKHWIWNSSDKNIEKIAVNPQLWKEQVKKKFCQYHPLHQFCEDFLRPTTTSTALPTTTTSVPPLTTAAALLPDETTSDGFVTANMGLIIAAIIGIALVCLLMVCGAMYFKRKSTKKGKAEDGGDSKMTSTSTSVSASKSSASNVKEEKKKKKKESPAGKEKSELSGIKSRNLYSATAPV